MSESLKELHKEYDFNNWLSERGLNLPPTDIDTLWLNITRLCNQSCRHCHLEASPEKPLHMNEEVMEACLRVLRRHERIKSVDITGGAPELHPRFDYLVSAVRDAGKQVTVRHNLTVSLDGNPLTGQDKSYLPRFLADARVEILASMPSLDEQTTDEIRGDGVFAKSLESLRRLNEAGYGWSPELRLRLVTNWDGPLSEDERIKLESEYKEGLKNYGIVFNDLLTVTNMPAGRYAVRLLEQGGYRDYMDRLVAASSCPDTIESAVCRTLVSVDSGGRLHDCDFNLALGMGLEKDCPGSIFEFDFNRLLERRVNFGPHCFGCSAGAGSG